MIALVSRTQERHKKMLLAYLTAAQNSFIIACECYCLLHCIVEHSICTQTQSRLIAIGVGVGVATQRRSERAAAAAAAVVVRMTRSKSNTAPTTTTSKTATVALCALAGCLGAAAAALASLGASCAAALSSAAPPAAARQAALWQWAPLACRAACAALMLALNAAAVALYVRCLRALPPTQATVVSNGANIASTGALAWAVFGQRPAARWLAGVAVAVCGICLISLSAAASTAAKAGSGSSSPALQQQRRRQRGEAGESLQQEPQHGMRLRSRPRAA